ncbi:MAG: helix-hairpin-helix domain-containing protein [Bacillota bacterium]|nr:helix-hairpin-helix domain-containing protein [Bacillota bacterium]
MGTLRQLKKNKNVAAPSPLNTKLMEAWNAGWSQGFKQGVKEQRERDIESTVTLLEGLETIPGIGEKLAWKIREHVIKQFSGEQA